MTLREYISHLNKMVENKPALLDVEMVCASDDEGNDYNPVAWYPSVMYTNVVEYGMEVYMESDLLEEGESPDDYIAVVCVN